MTFSRPFPALLATLLLPLATPAQTTWWGLTAAGGASGIGTIYSITEAGTFTKQYDFYRYEGGSPKGEVTKASNGLYYGVTEFGGTNGVGVLFSYNVSTGAYAVLTNFSTSTSGSSAIGARPYRGVVQASNGRLYGMCSQGGLNNVGTLWEYNITTSTFTKRVDFDALTTAAGKGSTPRGKLIQASNGSLYGVTQLGGVNSRGVLFQFNPSTNTYTKRFDFPALPGTTPGTQPFSGLMQATNGLLYGCTQLGGANGGGTIYSFNTSTNTVSLVYDFTQATGRFPLAELVQPSNGLLYGTTSQGGTNNSGVVFSYNLTTSSYTDLVNLSSSTGYSPFGRMIVGSSGLLYGTTNLGGTNGNGVLFSFNTTTNAYSLLVNLSSANMSDVWGGLIEDPAGTFVGMANSGGTGANGSLFKYVTSTSTLSELLPFSFSNGSTPKGRLIKASNGLFYGVTSAGGVSNTGILFSFDPSNSTFTRLVNFSSTIGNYPLGTLCEVSGKLYGLASEGGAANGGTLFEYTIASNTCVKKQDLSSTVGGAPQNGLIKASNGKLYGSTTTGATNNLGSLFEYIPSTNTITNIHSMATATGITVDADLMQASDGKLYGTASEGGAFSKGVLFSLNPANNAYTDLFDFDGLQGATPSGDLVQGNNGLLYGTFEEEGQGFNGGIFSWTIGTATYNEEYDFNIPPITTEGSASTSNLIKGTDGKLYGTSTQGGANGLGLLFRYDPVSFTVASLQSFAGTTNGQYPFDGLATDVAPSTSTSVQLAPKLFLEGPFNSGTGRMNTALRTLTGGNGFPTTEPFTGLGFTIVGGGGETTNSSVLTTTGDNAVVDWVLIELRDKNNSSTILRTKAALLQSDGDIVDVDNASPVTISVSADNYFVAIRSRNHLGVMTAGSIALSGSSVPVDFTTGALSTYGTNALKTVGAFRVCYAGNVVRDHTLLYTGVGNDRDPILVRVGSTTPNNTAAGYFVEDVNMDGTVSYTGANNDRDPILVNVGGTTPNNSITEQLP